MTLFNEHVAWYSYLATASNTGCFLLADSEYNLGRRTMPRLASSFACTGCFPGLEDIMPDPNLNQVLKAENELLDKLLQNFAGFAPSVGAGLAETQKLVSDWKTFIEGWKAVNEQVLGMGPAEQDQHLADERQRLQGMLSAASGSSFWVETLTRDDKTAEELQS